ncbi:acyl carrier protein [Pajaroellobacter abortibovis]|uniref:Carrier domain-containing protein n=1 Tax=Pajaroellobacter abortibovis TaxID=1882918 RepID=A0A1L6MVX6_9BACT|nr:acyl carrier protein [Pajaroellobacter abortibovis]APR99634.1 hypothetical protein BCY86_02295 [Pajaroellobacter abortibovis]
MVPTTLKEDLRALIQEIAEIDKVEETALFKDLGIDSMMGVEIVAAIERQYKITIHDSELQQVSTLEKSYELVRRKLEEKEASPFEATS